MHFLCQFCSKTPGIALAPQKHSAYGLCMQAVVAGQGLAGLAVSLLSFLTTWLYPPHTHTTLTPEDVRPAAFAYFTGAAGVMAWSLLGYLTFPYLPFAQQHTVPEGMPTGS